MIIRYLTLLFLGLHFGISYGQSKDAKSFTIYDSQQQKTLTLDEMIHRLAEYEVVFFGEEHNDSLTHALQLQVFQGLHKQKKEISLSMEMLVSDDQVVVDEFLKGLITERNFQKDVILWKNWSDYEPLFTYAKTHQLPVIAANAPSRYTNRVTQHGLASLQALSPEAKKWLAPLPIDTLTGAYYEKFIGLLGGHAGMGQMKIYQSQNLWDATMAHHIALHRQAFSQRLILHLCGHFHSDEHLGTVAQLRNYDPNAKIAVISCFTSDDFNKGEWNKHQNRGDFIILIDPQSPKTY